MSRLRRERMAGAARLRDGRPVRPRDRRIRPDEGQWFRLRHGPRARRHGPPRSRLVAPFHRQRHPLPEAVLMKVPLAWLREFIDLPTSDVDELSDAFNMLGHAV